ncbi:MAG: metal-dependent hydrolase [Candidatus Aenigmatarchaeota archaeon]
MDSMFHFIFPIIAALAARLNVKHPIKSILAAAVLTVLIDVDHFIGLERATFHNVFVIILLPLVLLYLAFHFRMNRYAKGFLLLLLVFSSSHLFLDLFSSPSFGTGIGIVEGAGPALFYPLSNTQYSIDFNIKIPMSTDNPPYLIEGYVISSLGFGILLYFIIILLPCLFLDDIIEIAERKRENLGKATQSFLKKSFRD